MAGPTPKDGRLEQEGIKAWAHESPTRDARSKQTEATPLIAKTMKKTRLSAMTNEGEKIKIVTRPKAPAIAPDIQEMQVHGSRIASVWHKETPTPSTLRRDTRTKTLKKLNKTSDNFFQTQRGSTIKEEPKQETQGDASNQQAGNEKEHLEKLISFHRESRTSRYQQTSPDKTEPLQEKSAIQTNELESAQHSVKPDKRPEEAANAGTITKIFSNSGSRKLSMNEGLPPISPIRTEMGHHQAEAE